MSQVQHLLAIAPPSYDLFFLFIAQPEGGLPFVLCLGNDIAESK